MKALIVYYSLEGHTDFVADILSEEVKGTKLKLIPKKEYPKGGFLKYLWGGKSIIFKDQPELENDIPNIDDYDTIFIGTPIWAGSFTPPILTFIKNIKVTNKNIGVFACHGGGGADKCFAKLKEELPNNKFIGMISFQEPKKQNYEDINREIVEWVRNMEV